MLRLISFLLCLAVIVSLCACSPSETSRSFQAMDTFMKLTVYGGDDLTSKLEDEIKALDRVLSAADKNSEIYRFNHSGSAKLSAETAEILKQALDLCQETDGALDITVLPVVEEWGFMSGDYKIPSKQRLNELLKSVDYKNLALKGDTASLNNNSSVDLGAVAKGYAADKAVKLLKDNNCSGAILNLGGTIAAFGSKAGGKSWRVGVADPDNSAAFMGFLDCKNKIIATSGSYERYFEGDDGKIYSHIIDPKTGQPVDNGIQSVTVISENGVRCDALSTALFVMGLDRAASYQKTKGGFDCVILTDSGKAYVSKGIAQSFTVADGYDYEIEFI